MSLKQPPEETGHMDEPKAILWNPSEVAKVIAIRRPFWTGYESWKRAAFELMSPLLFLWSAQWFVRALARGTNPFDDAHVVSGVFFCVVSLVGLLGIWMLGGTLRSVMLESACPFCGARSNRRYSRRSSRPSKAYECPPTACGMCGAYLRADGTGVVGESLDAVDDIGVPYQIPMDRYARGENGKARRIVTLKMPPMCGICSSPNVTSTRGLLTMAEDHGGVSTPGLDAVGAVVGEVVDTAVAVSDPQDYWRMHSGGGDSSSETLPEFNLALKRLKVPVCATHAIWTNRAYHVLAVGYKRALAFASYRYYQAFCELNEIYSPPPAADGSRPRGA